MIVEGTYLVVCVGVKDRVGEAYLEVEEEDLIGIKVDTGADA